MRNYGRCLATKYNDVWVRMGHYLCYATMDLHLMSFSPSSVNHPIVSLSHKHTHITPYHKCNGIAVKTLYKNISKCTYHINILIWKFRFYNANINYSILIMIWDHKLPMLKLTIYAVLFDVLLIYIFRFFFLSVYIHLLAHRFATKQTPN